MKKILFLLSVVFLTSCNSLHNSKKQAFNWEGANMYFLLTDRFQNGDNKNDIKFGRTEKAATLRGYEGG